MDIDHWRQNGIRQACTGNGWHRTTSVHDSTVWYDSREKKAEVRYLDHLSAQLCAVRDVRSSANCPNVHHWSLWDIVQNSSGNVRLHARGWGGNGCGKAQDPGAEDRADRCVVHLRTRCTGERAVLFSPRDRSSVRLSVPLEQRTQLLVLLGGTFRGLREGIRDQQASCSGELGKLFQFMYIYH